MAWIAFQHFSLLRFHGITRVSHCERQNLIFLGSFVIDYQLFCLKKGYPAFLFYHLDNLYSKFGIGIFLRRTWNSHVHL